MIVPRLSGTAAGTPYGALARERFSRV